MHGAVVDPLVRQIQRDGVDANVRSNQTTIVCLDLNGLIVDD
jgi:hypothetical protein